MDQIGPYNERNKAKRLFRVRRNREYVADLKARSECADCGAKHDLTFDHLPRFQKLGTISSLMVKPVTLTALMREVRKCRIVCDRCHKRRENFRGRSNHKV